MGNIPSLHTILAEWISCLMIILLLPKKTSFARILLYAVLTPLYLTGIFFIRELLGIWFWIPSMLLLVFGMYVFLLCTIEASQKVKLLYTAKAFMYAEFCASLEWQLATFFLGEKGMHAGEFDFLQDKISVYHILFLIVIYALHFCGMWIIEHDLVKDHQEIELGEKEVIFAVVTVAVVFAFSNLSFVYQNTPFSGRETIEIFNIRTLVDFAGIALLYSYHNLICRNNVQRELITIRAMLKSQYEKYRNYRESLDIVQMKYHDLKHQIEGIRASIAKEEKLGWLDQLEEELGSYEQEWKTGNPVLDTLIHGKMFAVRNAKIQLTMVADGKLLSFMHVMDICTIFGNLLDNAIESLLLVDDPDKKIIHLTISMKKNFLHIRMENYAKKIVAAKSQENFPTTKRDAKNHGIGLKSVRYCIEKYSGRMNIENEEGHFIVTILMPIPEQ